MGIKSACKSNLFAGAHRTDPPELIKYSIIVSRDSVHIAFMIDALNNINMYSTNIGNAYFNAPCKGGIWNITSPEFSSY